MLSKDVQKQLARTSLIRNCERHCLVKRHEPLQIIRSFSVHLPGQFNHDLVGMCSYCPNKNKFNSQVKSE